MGLLNTLAMAALIEQGVNKGVNKPHSISSTLKVLFPREWYHSGIGLIISLAFWVRGRQRQTRVVQCARDEELQHIALRDHEWKQWEQQVSCMEDLLHFSLINLAQQLNSGSQEK